MKIDHKDFSNELAIAELSSLSVNVGQKVLDTWSTSSTLEGISLFWDDFPESAKNALRIVALSFERLAEEINSDYLNKLRVMGRDYIQDAGRWRGAGVNLIPKEALLTSKHLESDYGEFYHGWGDYPIISSDQNLIAGFLVDIGQYWTEHMNDLPVGFNKAFYPTIAEFCQAWEHPLFWQLDESFIKELCKYIASCCRIPSLKNFTLETHSLVKDLHKYSADEIYFAYGSNMNRAQMAKRCPGAEPIAISAICNFEFYINSRGVAGVKPAVGKTCNGVLWQLKKEHWSTLDIYEGVRHGYYSKIQCKSMVSGEVVQSSLYISNDLGSGLPRQGYLEGIIDGAKNFNASEKWINSLQQSGLV